MTPRPLRIVHVLSHDEFESGGAIQAWLLAREQHRRGHSVAFVVNAGRNEDLARERFAAVAAAGLELVAVPMSGLRVFAGRRTLRAVVRAPLADVVHVHRERAVRFVLAALPRRGAPPVIAQKGNTYRLDRATAAAFQDPRIVAVIGVARAVTKKLAAKDAIPATKLHVVYGCFDRERFRERLDPEPIRRELNLAPRVRVVGVLANLDRKKGLLEFVETARTVLAVRQDVVFVIVGAGDHEALRAAADGAGIGPAFILTGFRRDADRMLSCFDVTVCASIEGEGLTGALRESLALGVPVVSTDVGGNRELVEDGVTGRLVRKRDPVRLAAAILDVLHDPAGAARMARAGQQLVVTTMSPEARATAVEAVYAQVIAAATLDVRSPA